MIGVTAPRWWVVWPIRRRVDRCHSLASAMHLYLSGVAYGIPVALRYVVP